MISPTDTAMLLSEALAATDAPLVSVIVHGSAVLGGWTPGRSDLDLLVVVEDDIGESDLLTLAGLLVRFEPNRAGMHLEASIVTRRAASAIRERWPYLAHVHSDRAATAEDTLAAPDADDPDLFMHYAVARHAGRAVFGEAARAVIGVVPRPSILRYLADEMGWGLAHGSAAYALLNACRARRYLIDDALVSKVDGGRQCLEEPGAPHAAFAVAIAWQCGGHDEPVLDVAARAYIEQTARMLREASGADQ